MELKFMENRKNAKYYLDNIINDIVFILEHTQNITYEEFVNDELLNNAISFKFIQISENSKQIPKEIIQNYQDVPWYKINGLRNKIVHDYGAIKLDIIYQTIKNDLPNLLKCIENISI